MKSLVNQIKEEIQQKNSLDALNRKQLITLERAFFQDYSREGCAKCERKQNLSLDHIVPIELLRQLGVDVDREFIEDNLRTLCRLCNVFKGNHLDFTTPKTKEILMRYLTKL